MNRIVKNNWVVDTLRYMNYVKKFDLSRVNFEVAVTSEIDQSVIAKR